MSPDRTASTTLRPAIAPRSAAPGTATPDGFAALLGAVDPAAPGRTERRDAGERQHAGRGPGEHAHAGRGPGDRPEAGRGPGDRAEAGRGPGDRPEAGSGPGDRAEAGRGPGDRAEAGRGPGDRPQNACHDDRGVVADPLAAPVPVAAAPDAPAVAAPAAEPVPADPLAALVAPVAAPDSPVAGASVPVVDAAPVAPTAPTAPALAAPPAVPAPMAAAPAPVAAPQPPTGAPAMPVAEPAAPVAELAADTRPTGPALPVADTPDAAPDTVTTAVVETPEPTTASPAGAAGTATGTGTGGEQRAPREQPAAAPAEAPVAAPSAPSAAPAQAAAPASLAGGPAQRTTPLHQAPRAVAQVIQVAQDRGISHAKLNLRPVELGGIEIRLQSSSAGVTAQVVADSPEAARLLQQAADDLRRSLERHDVTLLSLDVSTAGDGRPDGSAGASADLAGDRARHFAAFGGAPEGADAADVPAVVETVEIADGLHIDVLA